MLNYASVDFIISFTVSVIVLALAIFTLSKNSRNPINRIFFVLCTGLFMWSFGFSGTMLFPNVPANQAIHHLSLVVLGFGVFLFTYGFILLALHFPSGSKPLGKVKVILLGIVPLTAAILMPTQAGVVSFDYSNPDSIPVPNFGPAYFTIIMYGMACLITGIIVLVMKWRKSKGIEKSQIKYVFLGMTATMLMGFFFIVFMREVMGDTRFASFGILGILVFAGCVSYAIVRHRLMNINVILRRSIIYTAIIAIVSILYSSLIIYTQTAFGNSLGPILLASFLISFGMRPLENLVSKCTDRIFFRSSYDYKSTLAEISRRISMTINLDELTGIIRDGVMGAMKISYFDVLLPSGNGAFSGKSGSLPAGSPVLKFIKTNMHPIITEELEKMKYSGKACGNVSEVDSMINELNKLNASMVMPLVSKQKTVGIMAIGRKLSGDSFFSEDIELLSTIASHSATAIENTATIEKNMGIVEEKARAEERDKYVKDLEEKNAELMKFNKMAVSRELKMVELKRKLEGLKKKNI